MRWEILLFSSPEAACLLWAWSLEGFPAQPQGLRLLLFCKRRSGKGSGFAHLDTKGRAAFRVSCSVHTVPGGLHVRSPGRGGGRGAPSHSNWPPHPIIGLQGFTMTLAVFSWPVYSGPFSSCSAKNATAPMASLSSRAATLWNSVPFTPGDLSSLKGSRKDYAAFHTLRLGVVVPCNFPRPKLEPTF